MNPQEQEDFKHWRQDVKVWKDQAATWRDELALAMASLRELEGFLGAHGNQVEDLIEQVKSVDAAVEGKHHDAAKAGHHKARALLASLKTDHHALLARVAAVREPAAR